MAVYEVDSGAFVASSRGCWVPGSFTSERAAKYVFRFTPCDQSKMWEQWKSEHAEPCPDMSFEKMQAWRKTGQFNTAPKEGK